jgi:hypothetical protein
MNLSGKTKPHIIAALVLLIIPVSLITAKVTLGDYSLRKILPLVTYEVTFNYFFESTGKPVKIRTFLPITQGHQVISEETFHSAVMHLNTSLEEQGQIALWSGNDVKGVQQLRYSFTFQGKPVSYQIDSTLVIEKKFPVEVEKFTKASKYIQSNHPLIDSIYNELIDGDSNLFRVLRKIYAYSARLKPVSHKGLIDAVTAATTGEASCNGKSRLFAALAQRAGVPARLVGGIILENGKKKTSHQWVEVYAQGVWVPFDALNKHFAFLPGNYLIVYKQDEFLVTHTPGISFDYNFEIVKKATSHSLRVSSGESFGIFKMWALLRDIGVPLDMITILLILPLGASLVAIFRNVIGIKTFGVFLPVLIAIASREIGLLPGMLVFVIILILLSIIHKPLEKVGLLYVPKIVIMLVCVVIAFISISLLGTLFDIGTLTKISLFPVIVVTIAAERFSTSILEDGYTQAIKLVIQTLSISSVVFLVTRSYAVESFFLAFPELLLAVIALNLLLGKWIGLRLTEYSRFKWILK